MVENPASSVGSEMANRDLDADADRLANLARRGAVDPASLKPEEIREICEALASRIAAR